jgi:hypothetical protein
LGAVGQLSALGGEVIGIDSLFFHGDILPGTEVTQNSSIARNKAKQNSPLWRVPKHL